ncbi:MAG: DUF6751 family protein [Oscillospiraceae bacterium]
MIKNSDITLYHKSYSEKARTDIWQHTQFMCVSFHGKQAVSVEKSGLNAANVYTVRIYTKQALEIANGDIIVRGLFADESPDLARKKARESFVVTAVIDNRRGSKAVQHFRIEGK